MCLILTVVFLVLSFQAMMDNEWPFALIYGLLTLFFVWLLQNNVRAVLIHKGRCSPGGCSLFSFFKRSDKKPDDEDLGNQ